MSSSGVAEVEEADGVGASAASGDGEEPDPVTVDDAFELLSNRRRRYVLHYLKHRGPGADLGELSEYVAAWETDTVPSNVDATARKRVYTSLQSHHLPKMSDQGIVEYDARSGEVALTATADDLDVYLEVVGDKDLPWSQYYLGLSLVNTVVLATVWAGLWPLSVLPTVAWMAFVVTTYAASALVHSYHSSVSRLGSHPTPPELRD